MVPEQIARFPATRYQGSKRKLLPWLMDVLAEVPCETVLDPFSGTGAVAYGFKALGKQVVACDLLRANHRVAEALVANDHVLLDPDEAAALVEPRPGMRYPTFIADTFRDVYYTDEENAQLDVAAANLAAMGPGPRRALASFALFQACLVKRPFNLFHRRNLSLRLADVRRSFGNKRTWERPFPELLERFAREASAAVFPGARPCRAAALDVFDAPTGADLVYLDPPYVPARGAGADYPRYYHFLEGLTDPAGWPSRIDRESRNLRLRGSPSPWIDGRRVRSLLRALFHRHRSSVIALSYRSDGIPDPEDIERDLRAVRGQVSVHDAGSYQYALSTNRRSRELLFVAS